MDGVLNGALHQLLGLLGVVYTHEWVVPFVLLPLMLLMAGYLHVRARREISPYFRAAESRTQALKSALGSSEDPLAERQAFAAAYIDVSTAMAAEGRGADALVQAWREFQESIIDENADPIRNTNRPSVYFSRVAPRLNFLTFASNVFVGVGLILTFLGLIVALSKASQGMSGDDVQAAKRALAGLLTVAGAKFFTSVGGLGASIWLRFVEHGLSRRSRASVDTICLLLERGLLYVPPQRLAVEQLEIMREQRDQLKTFNTDFAMQLGDRIGAQFHQALAPMATSISQMVDSMNDVTAGIGDGARKAIEEVSGDQLRGLSEVLATLGLKIEAISTAVGSSGDEAARQIRDAGSDFARAAADIREAFDHLAAQVGRMGGALQAQSEEAARVQNDVLERVLGDVSAAQAKSAEAMAEAVEGLKRAGLEAAATMQSEVQAVLATGVAEGQRAFAGVLEESGDQLRASALGLAKAVSDASDSVERASAGFVRSGESAVRSAETMSGVTGQANALVSSIQEAGRGFGAVAAPVVKAVQAVDDAVSKIKSAIESGRAADVQALEQMRALAEQMKGTFSSAEEAWASYRQRFADVDKALANSADKMSVTLGESLETFASFARKTDSELAGAVSKLAITLSSIEDYAESLDKYVDQRAAAAEAAE